MAAAASLPCLPCLPDATAQGPGRPRVGAGLQAGCLAASLWRGWGIQTFTHLPAKVVQASAWACGLSLFLRGPCPENTPPPCTRGETEAVPVVIAGINVCSRPATLRARADLPPHASHRVWEQHCELAPTCQAAFSWNMSLFRAQSRALRPPALLCWYQGQMPGG